MNSWRRTRVWVKTCLPALCFSWRGGSPLASTNSVLSTITNQSRNPCALRNQSWPGVHIEWPRQPSMPGPLTANLLFVWLPPAGLPPAEILWASVHPNGAFGCPPQKVVEGCQGPAGGLCLAPTKLTIRVVMKSQLSSCVSPVAASSTPTTLAGVEPAELALRCDPSISFWPQKGSLEVPRGIFSKATFKFLHNSVLPVYHKEPRSPVMEAPHCHDVSADTGHTMALEIIASKLGNQLKLTRLPGVRRGAGSLGPVWAILQRLACT